MNEGHGGVLRPRRRMLDDRSNVQRMTYTPQTLTPQSGQLTHAQWAARRSARTTDMVEALRRVDTAPTEQARREIVEWLREVYEARGGGELVGLFGHCYLGSPYVDHAFDLGGTIRDHYTPADTVPPMYAAARPFAASEAYAYIEIYADGQVIPIRPDGSSAL